MDRLRSQSAGLIAGLATAGAALTLGGCGQSNQPEVAKFSSLGNNSSVDLNTVEQAKAVHGSVASAVSGLEGSVRELAKDVKDGRDATASLTTARLQAKALNESITSAEKSSTFKPDAAQLTALKSVVSTLETASGSELTKDQVTSMEKTLGEWNVALKRDVQMLDRGVNAARVAKLEVVLRRSESALTDAMKNLAASSPSTYDVNSENHRSILKALDDAKEGLNTASRTSFFRNVSKDLTDAATLVGDARMTLESEANVEKYWTREVGKTDSQGAAVCQAAKDLLAAIAADNQAELTKTLGVKPDQSGRQSGTQHVYHHNSGLDFGDLLLYHMIFNSGPSYSYYPTAHSYSSPDRMYNSSGYNRYNSSYGSMRTTAGSNRSFRSSSSMSSSTRGTTYRASQASSGRSSSVGRSGSGRASGGSRSGGGFGRSGGGRSGGG